MCFVLWWESWSESFLRLLCVVSIKFKSHESMACSIQACTRFWSSTLLLEVYNIDYWCAGQGAKLWILAIWKFQSQSEHLLIHNTLEKIDLHWCLLKQVQAGRSRQMCPQSCSIFSALMRYSTLFSALNFLASLSSFSAVHDLFQCWNSHFFQHCTLWTDESGALAANSTPVFSMKILSLCRAGQSSALKVVEYHLNERIIQWTCTDLCLRLCLRSSTIWAR